MIGKCSSCSAEIEWCVTQNGATMPVDPEPVADGNVVHTGDYGRIGGQDHGRPAAEVRVLKKGEVVEPHITRHVAHFVTCPKADRHRKKVPAGRVNSTRTGGARSRSSHPPTSKAAASGLRLGKQQRAVLIDLWDRTDGATAWDLAVNEHGRIVAVRPNVSPNQVGSRFAELRDLGLIEYQRDDDGEPVTRKAAAGNAIVHRCTSAGRAEARRLASEVD